MEDCFTEDSIPDCPDDQNCHKCADYLLENYVILDSKFTPDMWSGIPSEEKGTKGATDSFHNHCNDI